MVAEFDLVHPPSVVVEFGLALPPSVVAEFGLVFPPSGVAEFGLVLPSSVLMEGQVCHCPVLDGCGQSCVLGLVLWFHAGCALIVREC